MHKSGLRDLERVSRLLIAAARSIWAHWQCKHERFFNLFHDCPLSAFVYRFNRRFYLDTLPMHLRVPPLPLNYILQLGFAKMKNLANQE